MARRWTRPFGVRCSRKRGWSETARFLFYQDSLPFEPGGMHCLNMYLEMPMPGNAAPRVRGGQSLLDWPGGNLAKFQMVFRGDAGLAIYWAAR